MTTSVQKDALLSQFSTLAYKDNAYLDNQSNLPVGWKLVASDDTHPPFAAFVFKNTTSGEVVTAFRGTDGFGDASADKAIALGKWDPQFQAGMDFYESVKRDTTIFDGGYDRTKSLVAGHSLGGAIAQIVGQAYGLDGSTIDPGAAARIVQTSEFLAATVKAELPEGGIGISHTFNNYVVAASLVSNGTGTQLGNVSFLPSLTFSGVDAAKAFLVGMVNPIAGFAYAVGVDQFSNKHSSAQINEAMQLLSGAAEDSSIGPDRIVLTPKVTGWDNNPATGQQNPRYSQTEFELRDKDGNLQGTVKFSAAAMGRQFEVFDETGALQSTTSLSETGTITVKPVHGNSKIITYSIPDMDSSEGTVETTTADSAGNLQTQTHTNIQYDDNGAPITIETVVTENGTTQNIYDKNNQLVKTQSLDNGANTLAYAAGSTAIFLSLIKAIQTGQPLPIAVAGVNSVLALQSAVSGGRADVVLSGAGAALSALSSLYSLQKNIERGDALAAGLAAAQTLQFGVTAYTHMLTAQFGGDAIAAITVDGASNAAAFQFTANLGAKLPYLSLVNDIAHGNPMGIAFDVIAIAQPALAPFLAVTNLIFSSLFGDDSPPPQPWGNGRFVWNPDGTLGLSTVGGNGGEAAVQSSLQGLQNNLQTVLSNAQRQGGSAQIGLVANRLPSLSYSNAGFALTDLDPVTGADRTLHYDSNGTPTDAVVGSAEYFRRVNEQLIYSALGREAIAPEWEVNTARLQALAGDPQAGLTELQRAQRNSQLAAAPDPATSLKTWRPVLLDLNGDGVKTLSKDQAQVVFDIDSSGFLKSTAWVSKQDGFLVLDRNFNSLVDNGSELFSNNLVANAAKGLASLRWIDANGDSNITAADPVFSELRVWRDANGNGAIDNGEALSLAALGISALHYGLGSYDRAGQTFQMASPDLLADAVGTRSHAIEGDISNAIFTAMSEGNVWHDSINFKNQSDRSKCSACDSTRQRQLHRYTHKYQQRYPNSRVNKRKCRRIFVTTINLENH